MRRGTQAILLSASLVLIVTAIRLPLLPIPLERDEGEYADIAGRGAWDIMNCRIVIGLTKNASRFLRLSIRVNAAVRTYSSDSLRCDAVFGRICMCDLFPRHSDSSIAFGRGWQQRCLRS